MSRSIDRTQQMYSPFDLKLSSLSVHVKGVPSVCDVQLPLQNNPEQMARYAHYDSVLQF